MDSYSEFRFGPPKVNGIPGQAPQTRFPLSQTPSARSHCRMETFESDSDTLDGIPAASRRHQHPPQVQAQVKQLQFWLKVFSRFCQDEC